MPVIDGLLFGNSNHPGVHSGSGWANGSAGPNPAPAWHSPNRKPAPDAKPWRKVSVSDAAQRANQNQTSVHSLPACTMNLFLGPRARGGVGTACGSGNNVGNRSEVVFTQRQLGEKSPQTARR